RDRGRNCCLLLEWQTVPAHRDIGVERGYHYDGECRESAQNQSTAQQVTHEVVDFVKTYVKEIDSAIPFSGVSSPTATNGVEKAAVGVGIVAGFVNPDGEAGKGAVSTPSSSLA